MGVVRRQSIKTSIITYAFMVFSIIASIYIFPLNVDLYGTLSFFIDTATLIVPLFLLGMSAVSIRFFPEIKERYGSGSMLIWSLNLVLSLTITLSIVIFLIAKPQLTELFAGKSKLLSLDEWIWFLIPMAVALALQVFLSFHISNYKLVAFPKLVQSLIRLTLPVVFLLVFLEKVDIQIGLYLILIYLIISVIILLRYLNSVDKITSPNWGAVIDFLSTREVMVFSVFTIMANIGSNVAFRLDSFMLTAMIDTSNNGVYQIGNKIGSIIAVPMMAILSISAPLISASMKKKNYQEVGSLYVRSSEILTVAGVFLISGLWVVGPIVFELMPNGSSLVSQGAFTVVTLIALARFIDMITSVNTHIITLSQYFRYNLLFLIILGTSNVFLNLLLIPKYGLEGAAYSTFISMLAYNTLKISFIRWKMKLWPFTFRTLLIMGLGVVCALIVSELLNVDLKNNIVNLLVNGGLVVVLLFTGLYLTRLSEDFNEGVKAVISKVKSYLNL